MSFYKVNILFCLVHERVRLDTLSGLNV